MTCCQNTDGDDSFTPVPGQPNYAWRKGFSRRPPDNPVMALRWRAGFTRRELADILGLSFHTLETYELRHTKFSQENRKRYAKALGVSWEVLCAADGHALEEPNQSERARLRRIEDRAEKGLLSPPIRRRREALGLTQADVEGLLNYANGWLGRIERGQKTFGLEKVEALYDSLESTTTDTPQGETDMQTTKTAAAEGGPTPETPLPTGIDFRNLVAAAVWLKAGSRCGGTWSGNDLEVGEEIARAGERTGPIPTAVLKSIRDALNDLVRSSKLTVNRSKITAGGRNHEVRVLYKTTEMTRAAAAQAPPAWLDRLDWPCDKPAAPDETPTEDTPVTPVPEIETFTMIPFAETIPAAGPMTREALALMLSELILDGGDAAAIKAENVRLKKALDQSGLRMDDLQIEMGQILGQLSATESALQAAREHTRLNKEDRELLSLVAATFEVFSRMQADETFQGETFRGLLKANHVDSARFDLAATGVRALLAPTA